MSNEVVNEEHQILIKVEEAPQNQHMEVNNSIKTDYNTIEKSLDINENSTSFDMYKGLIFMLLSCIMKSIYSVLCKWLMSQNESITSFQLLCYKGYFLLAICTVVCFYCALSNKKSEGIYNISRDDLYGVGIRSTMCVISTSLIIIVLKRMSISDVYTVYYIYPGIVIIFSFMFLKQKVAIFDYICLAACLIGVMLIIRPDFLFGEQHHVKNAGLLFSLLIATAFMKAGEDIIIKNLGSNLHFTVISSGYSVMAVLLYPIAMVVSGTGYNKMEPFEYFLIFTIAVFSFLYTSFMTLALQNENAGRVSMVNYLQVPFMFLFDIFLFHKKMIIWDCLGTTFIFSFNFINGMTKAIQRKQELDRVKNKSNTADNSTLK